MLIIPEIETVVLQPPRTGTTSLRDAVLAKYGGAFLLYRHMEYAGIPAGYENWRVVCQVREPASRLMSVYKYMCAPIIKKRTCLKWRDRMMAATKDGFDAWLSSSEVFTSTGVPGHLDFRPRDSVRHQHPEQVKSQALWGRRADEYLLYEQLADDAATLLGVVVEHKNASQDRSVECDHQLVGAHLQEHFSWDLDLYDWLNATDARR